MEMGLLLDYFGIFSMHIEKIIFAWREVCKVSLNPLEVGLK